MNELIENEWQKMRESQERNRRYIETTYRSKSLYRRIFLGHNSPGGNNEGQQEVLMQNAEVNNQQEPE